MSVKTHGAEYKKFLDDPIFWPEAAWMEDETLTVDGVEVDPCDFDPLLVGDTVAITIQGGCVYLDNNGLLLDKSVSLETHFKRWRKTQDVTRILVEITQDKAQALKDAIKTAGGKLV